MRKLLFYFNGFNSAIPRDWSDNAKIRAVDAYARRNGYRFLPTTVDYRRAAACARGILDRLEVGPPPDADGPARAGSGRLQQSAAPRVLFSGSSMGGWYARIMQLLLARERPGLEVLALAFNPAFDLRLHGHMLLGPQINFVTGEHYVWTAQDSDRLARLERSVDYDAPLPFCVYVDKGDEVIAWEPSAKRHAGMARFVAFEGGSHSFEHADKALADFHAAQTRCVAALEAGRTTW